VSVGCGAGSFVCLVCLFVVRLYNPVFIGVLRGGGIDLSVCIWGNTLKGIDTPAARGGSPSPWWRKRSLRNSEMGGGGA
jgi:hypothetical protein